jgi:adenylylsulfate kinase-like enzyme
MPLPCTPILSRDLGFRHEGRVEHARRLGWMCDRVVEAVP